ELPQVVLDDPARLHADGLADDADRDRQMELLVTANGEEVDVDEAPVDVIALHVPRDDQVLGPVDDQVDEDVRPGPGVQDVEQVPGVHRHGGRVHPVPVQHPGDAAGGPQAGGDA